MSLLSVNRTLVGISRNEMMMLQVNRMTKRVVAKQQVTMPVLSDEVDWNGILPTLERLFSTSNLPQSKAISVTLASDFVRYLILPPVNNLMRAADRVAFAKAAYLEIYGTQVDKWQIQCDDALPGEPALCAAIDQSLMGVLAQFVREKGYSLSNVQPYLMPVFNRTQSQFPQESFYFTVVESNRLVLAYLQAGRWQQIRNLPLEQDWLAQMDKVLQREFLLSEQKNKPSLFIYAPQDNTKSLTKLEGWQFKRVGVDGIQRQAKPYTMLEVAL